MEDPNAQDGRTGKTLNPTVVASTGPALDRDSYPLKASAADAVDSIGRPQWIPEQGHFFKGAQWTPDGQCLVTSAEDWVLRTFVLSPDILTPKTEDETGLIPQINPWTSQQRPQLIRDFAVYPGFNLQDLNTTLVLSSTNDQPIRLGNVMDPNQSTYAHYPLIWATTEEYIGPTALTFTSDGNRFITGSKNLIAAFDVSRPNEQPIMQYRTDLSGASVRTKGVVSSFAISSQSTLAAGTFNRAVIIYGDEGFASEPMATFSLATKLAQPNPLGSGNGVSSMAWSPCGRYLYVSERKSECVHLYDIRGLGRRLASLVRPAETAQQTNVDVVETMAGYEIWAGGSDGMVRMWENPSLKEGRIEADTCFEAHDGSVTSTIVHPCGSILATCAAQDRRTIPATYDSDSESDSESSNCNADDSVPGSDSDSKSHVLRDSAAPSSLPSGPRDMLKIWTL